MICVQPLPGEFSLMMYLFLKSIKEVFKATAQNEGILHLNLFPSGFPVKNDLCHFITDSNFLNYHFHLNDYSFENLNFRLNPNFLIEGYLSNA